MQCVLYLHLSFFSTSLPTLVASCYTPYKQRAATLVYPYVSGFTELPRQGRIHTLYIHTYRVSVW